MLDERPVFFFDIDDCLYSQTLGVNALMEDLIDQFIMRRLGVSRKVATALNEKYYREFGLTVIGLQRLHGIDPIEFNQEVDDMLPMDELLSRSEELIRFFSSFDSSRVKLWLLTNAYVNHGLRVSELLGITRFFEGITYCDYTSDTWICKPSQEMLAKAESEAGAMSSTQCFFVDDNIKNCTAASQRGWQVLWITNDKMSTKSDDSGLFRRIFSLQEIHRIHPQFMGGQRTQARTGLIQCEA